MVGTYVEILLEGDCPEDELINLSEKGFDEIVRIEKIMSFRDESSELAMINRQSSKGSVEISEEMAQVLGLSLKLSALTDGAYDLSIASCLVGAGLLPKVDGFEQASGDWRDMQLAGRMLRFERPLILDLGGIAKGYAVDCALRAIGEDVNVVVNAGGDIRMNPWQGKSAEIRFPYNGRFVSIEWSMLAPAMATSASYFHEGDNPIFSPLSQEPIKDDRSITVFADTCMLADALTKIAFLSHSGLEIIKGFGATAVIVKENGEFVTSEDYADNS